jgi:hypothetical protein
LCTLEKDLQDSHSIGNAVYKKLMEPSIRNPQPIVITSENLKQSPVQLRDDVFCSDCEQIFNLGGESWIHKHIATTTGFKLLDLFTGQTLIIDEPDFKMYDAVKIPSVDCPAMLEYGAGVLFKSAVHRWKFEDGTSSPIDLGPERTAQFLGVIPPIGMVIGGTEDEKYYFYVSGVYYCLMVGAGIDTSMKALGFNQPLVKPVLVGDEWAEQALGIMKGLAHGITPSPKLKEVLKPRE